MDTLPTSADCSNRRAFAKNFLLPLWVRLVVVLSLFFCAFAAASAQSAPAASNAAPTSGNALALYRKLGSVGLDVKQTFAIREVDLNLEDLHLSLEDGTIAFTHAVDGHVTGAFFVGEGEVLIIPPDNAERASLALFTGAAVLEEKFSSAYLRFDDAVAGSFAPGLRPAEDPAGFVAKWDSAATSLAATDAVRLLLDFDNAPAPGGKHMLLHARLNGEHLGVFDVLFDSALSEQISVAQTGYTRTGGEFYDVWMSFAMRSARDAANASDQGPVSIHGYKINVQVLPDDTLNAAADVRLQANYAGIRAISCELSRFLQVSSATIAGSNTPLEVIQNQAIPGSQLARRGNDAITVVAPQAFPANQPVTLHIEYSGSVISDVGGGLKYVGARGSWYPNRGPSMADFDITFRYPAALTLAATGKQLSHATQDGEQAARWVSEKPIPMAGFNLGQFASSSANIAGTTITSYDATGVEALLASRARAKEAELDTQDPFTPPDISSGAPVVTPPQIANPQSARPKPMEQRAVASVDFFEPLWGKFPYSALQLTPFPSPDSQGWPGLIFLSEYSFLPQSERPTPARAEDAAYRRILYDELMPAHEIAHQWWGDALTWESYHDQWMMEALANYSALLEIKAHDPKNFDAIMHRYRDDLVQTNAQGQPYTDAGPLTLGLRLSSSHFPYGFERVLYERGAWLMQMLRDVLEDPAEQEKPHALADEPFFKALRELQTRFAGKSVSTADLQQACEQYLPADVNYEGKHSLNWFFHAWINGDSVPQIDLQQLRINRRTRMATGRLIQSNAPDDLVTLVPLYAASGSAPLMYVGRVFADGNESSFKIKVPPGTTKLLPDPYHRILRTK